MRVSDFIRENGLMITAGSAYKRLTSRIVSRALARQIGAGPGFLVGPHSHIRGCRHIAIGKNFSAGLYLRLEAVVEHGDTRYSPCIRIGDNVSVSDFVHIAAVELVEIHDGVLMGSKIHITDHAHGSYSSNPGSDPEIPPALRPLSNGGAVCIGRNSWIGEMVNILPGVTIGTGCIIGAGSVVTRDIPDHTIAVGSPAKPIKRYDRSLQAWVSC